MNAFRKRDYVRFPIAFILGLVLSMAAFTRHASAASPPQADYDDVESVAYDSSDLAFQAPPLPRWLMTIGVGMSRASRGTDMKGVGGTLELNYHLPVHHLITLRSTGFFDLGSAVSNVVDGLFSQKHGKEGSVRDIGLLYGWINRSHYGYISASTGVSYFVGRRTRSFDMPENDPHYFVKRTVGIPIELQAIWRPWKSFGLGFIGTADINKAINFFGVVFAMQFAF